MGVKPHARRAQKSSILELSQIMLGHLENHLYLIVQMAGIGSVRPGSVNTPAFAFCAEGSSLPTLGDHHARWTRMLSVAAVPGFAKEKRPEGWQFLCIRH